MSKIIIFEHINCTGNSLVVTTNTPNLILKEWNDKVSSLIVINGAWDLFNDCNYSGQHCSVHQLGGPTNDGVYPKWTDWNGTNDVLSSLKPQY